MEAVRAGGIDVVLMDLRMPVLDGIAATEAVMRRPDSPRVIVLTTFGADEYVVRALAAGASGFLLKDTPPAHIVEAIARVADGEPALSPAVVELLIRQVTAGPAERTTRARRLVDRLSEREREVAEAIGHGASNTGIAEDLVMSVATVKSHISRLFAKLEASNRVQVAIRMHEAGPR